MTEKDYTGLKVIFLSSTEFAIPSLDKILESRHELAGIVTRPDKPRGRGRKYEKSILKDYASKHSIPCFDPVDLRDAEFIKQLDKINPEIGVVVDFRILPKEVFAIPKFGTIGIHPSLLPAYRGAAPINWAIINGDKETGITAFILNERVDAGDMLLKKKIKIKEDETSGELRERLSFESVDFLMECIDKIQKDDIAPVIQDISELSKASKIKPHHLIIDWSKSAEEIHNLIRGLSPSPTAYTTYKNGRIKIFCSKIIDRNKTEGMPGSVYCADVKKGFIINTGEGLLSIEELMKEGKKKMSSKNFLLGAGIEVGEILG
ncbi:methionyl-tRNA formyltransferase [bacterium]|nr:methionyl-tRNA formyltransferase [bacterium]